MKLFARNDDAKARRTEDRIGDGVCDHVGVDSFDCQLLPPQALAACAGRAGHPYKYASSMSARSIARINQLFRADFEIFEYAPV